MAMDHPVFIHYGSPCILVYVGWGARGMVWARLESERGVLPVMYWHVKVQKQSILSGGWVGGWMGGWIGGWMGGGFCEKI